MPPFTTSYSLNHNEIIPKDYFGSQRFSSIDIYDPKKFEDWYERADVEIYRYMQKISTNIIVIKGYGIYVYDRDINQMAKTVALLENSCKLLYYAHDFGRNGR
jgi:L-fuculose-phosphate aldolase